MDQYPTVLTSVQTEKRRKEPALPEEHGAEVLHVRWLQWAWREQRGNSAAGRGKLL